MGLLKLLILVCGGLGLGLVLNDNITAKFEHDMVTTLFIVGGFAVAALMGLLALFKPPFESWQATAALAGFVVVGIKTRVWDAIPEFMNYEDIKIQLGIAAIVVGAVVSLILVVKPERTF